MKSGHDIRKTYNVTSVSTGSLHSERQAKGTEKSLQLTGLISGEHISSKCVLLPGVGDLSEDEIGLKAVLFHTFTSSKIYAMPLVSLFNSIGNLFYF